MQLIYIYIAYIYKTLITIQLKYFKTKELIYLFNI